MLFDSKDLLYFEVLRPKNISYIYKVRPAKDFGSKFVSSTCNKHTVTINRNCITSVGKIYHDEQCSYLRFIFQVVHKLCCSYTCYSCLSSVCRHASKLFVAKPHLFSISSIVCYLQLPAGFELSNAVAFDMQSSWCMPR